MKTNHFIYAIGIVLIILLLAAVAFFWKEPKLFESPAAAGLFGVLIGAFAGVVGQLLTAATASPRDRLTTRMTTFAGHHATACNALGRLMSRDR